LDKKEYMIIKHKKEKFNITECKSIFSQLFGLMFRFPKNDGLLFIFKKEKYISLHMFFVFYPIDIIYLNQNKIIIKIIKKALPFTLFIPPVKCKYILELKNSKNLKLNEKILL